MILIVLYILDMNSGTVRVVEEGVVTLQSRCFAHGSESSRKSSNRKSVIKNDKKTKLGMHKFVCANVTSKQKKKTRGYEYPILKRMRTCWLLYHKEAGDSSVYDIYLTLTSFTLFRTRSEIGKSSDRKWISAILKDRSQNMHA